MATQGIGDTRVLVAKRFLCVRACKERDREKGGKCVKNGELKKREGATGEKGVARGAWGCFPHTRTKKQRPPKESRHREGKRIPRLLSSFRRLIAFVALTAVCVHGSPRFRFAPVVCAHTFALLISNGCRRASTCGCCWGEMGDAGAMQCDADAHPPPICCLGFCIARGPISSSAPATRRVAVDRPPGLSRSVPCSRIDSVPCRPLVRITHTCIQYDTDNTDIHDHPFPHPMYKVPSQASTAGATRQCRRS